MGRTSGHEGSVRRVPGGPGTWQARLPKRLDPHRRPLPQTYPSQREARAALRAAVVDMDRNAGLGPGSRVNGKVRRVRDVLADYIEARQYSALAPIAIRTVRDYRSVLENHVNRPKANIGHVPVHKLTGRDIRAWMDDLAAEGVGPGTVANARRVLGAALAWEVREGRLGVNPATHVRVETSKARRTAMQTVDPVLLPSWAEFATLVETPVQEHDRLLMALLGWCGLRWSEAVSLHEQAIWRDRPQITIDRVLVRRTQKEVDADTGVGLHLLENNYWRQEPPKAGVTATVPMPRCPDRCGGGSWGWRTRGCARTRCRCRRDGCSSDGRSFPRPTPTALAYSTTPTGGATCGFRPARGQVWSVTTHCPRWTRGAIR